MVFRQLFSRCAFPRKAHTLEMLLVAGNFISPDLIAKFSRLSRVLIHRARTILLIFCSLQCFNILSLRTIIPLKCPDTAKEGRGNLNAPALILHKCSIIAVLSFYWKIKGKKNTTESKLGWGEIPWCFATKCHRRARSCAVMRTAALMFKDILLLIIIPLLIKYLIYK